MTNFVAPKYECAFFSADPSEITFTLWADQQEIDTILLASRDFSPHDGAKGIISFTVCPHLREEGYHIRVYYRPRSHLTLSRLNRLAHDLTKYPIYGPALVVICSKPADDQRPIPDLALSLIQLSLKKSLHAEHTVRLPAQKPAPRPSIANTDAIFTAPPSK